MGMLRRCNLCAQSAAAGTDATQPVVDWLARASTGAHFQLLGLTADSVEGPIAVCDAWYALRAGFRALGIESKEGLVEWHRRQGYGPLALNAYLQAHVQVRLLADSFAASKNEVNFQHLMTSCAILVSF